MRAPAVPDNCVILLSVADVTKTLKQVNIHKASGPDGLPGSVLRACMDKLASVDMKCFERPVMAHISTIIPDTLATLQ
jgi:hypothetical protein